MVSQVEINTHKKKSHIIEEVIAKEGTKTISAYTYKMAYDPKEKKDNVKGCLYIPREIPVLQPLGVLALGLCPWVPICQGAEVSKVPNGDDRKHGGNLQPHSWPKRRSQ
jgi:hypothetical protein